MLSCRALGVVSCQGKVLAPSAMELYWISMAEALQKTPPKVSGLCQSFPAESQAYSTWAFGIENFVPTCETQCQGLLPGSSLKVCSDVGRSNPKHVFFCLFFYFFFFFANESQKSKYSIQKEEDCIKSHTSFYPNAYPPAYPLVLITLALCAPEYVSVNLLCLSVLLQGIFQIRTGWTHLAG